MARSTGGYRKKAGVDVDLEVVRDAIRTGSRIKRVRGYVRVEREAGVSEMTFTTLEGLALLVKQLEAEYDQD